jgi:ABC-2 type transport system ATP-binding protein
VIELHDLVKAYDGFHAVDGLSLRVEPGEILGLVGPNGAGKTTTLRCLAGIIPPTSGRVVIAGFDLSEQPIEAKQRLAFVPDEPHLFDHLTALDHLILFSRLYGVADGPTRAETMLAEAGLHEQRLSFPGEFSRGMKQKLVVACALLYRPEVLVLDEPLTGLDPAAMRRMKRTVVDTAGAGASVIVSSHMLQLVEEICDRVLIVSHGKTVLEGTLDEIRTQIPNVDRDADLETLFLKATGEAELS